MDEITGMAGDELRAPGARLARRLPFRAWLMFSFLTVRLRGIPDVTHHSADEPKLWQPLSTLSCT
jgi:hypothetical protein